MRWVVGALKAIGWIAASLLFFTAAGSVMLGALWLLTWLGAVTGLDRPFEVLLAPLNNSHFLAGLFVGGGLVFGLWLRDQARQARREKDEAIDYARLKVLIERAMLHAHALPRIADYKAARLTTTVRRAGSTRPITPATVNRDLSILRHLLRLAVEEWEGLRMRPRIRLLKEPEGRIRWLEPDEEARLLAACRASKAGSYLPDMVTVVLETGLRKGELLGLRWDRVDLSRGVIRLEFTKRREVPMRQVVYDILVARQGPARAESGPARTSPRRSSTPSSGRGSKTSASTTRGTTSPRGLSCGAGACRP